MRARLKYAGSHCSALAELRLVRPSAQLEGRSMLDPTPESVQARVRGRHARALVKAELRVHPISQRLARGEVEHSALVAVGLDGRAAQRAGMTRLVPNLTENFPRARTFRSAGVAATCCQR